MIRTVIATESRFPGMNQASADWASVRIFGEPGRFEHYSTMTITRSGDIVGVVVFHNWNSDAGVIELSIAGVPGWQSRRVWNEIFGFCFDTMKCQMVALRISERNRNAISQAARLGFIGTVMPRFRGRNEAEIIFCLTGEDWKSGRIYRPSGIGYCISETAHTGTPEMRKRYGQVETESSGSLQDR